MNIRHHFLEIWQRRLEKAAIRADEIGRDVLAKLLRQEIVNYQEFAEGREEAYQTVEDWMHHEPDLTLAQVKRSIADLHGLLVSEVGTKLRRFKKVFMEAKQEAQEARALKAAWLKEIAAFIIEKESSENLAIKRSERGDGFSIQVLKTPITVERRSNDGE